MYDRTKPFVDGRVSPDGVDLTVFEYKSPERHRRMLKHTEFDICELSLGSYLASIEKDYPFTAIPVFPHRKFRHGYYFVNAESDIDTPRDLEGKRVGIRRWQNTAGLWMRGIARDYYNVDTSQITWYIDDEDEIPPNIPDQYETHRIPNDRDIDEMLVERDLDAAMYPKRLSSFVDGSTSIKRLFPEYRAEEEQYYQDTKNFPIMHVVAIRDELVEKHPWLPMNIRKAFEEAKREGLSDIDHTRKISFVWGTETLEYQREVLGSELELWDDTIEGCRSELEAAISYAVEDGLLSDRIEPEDLFIESSVENLPEYA